MPRDVSIHWNLTFDMVEFATEYRAALDIMTADRDIMNLHKFELSKKEWGMVIELCEVLQVCYTFIFLHYWTNLLLISDFQARHPFFSRDTPNISTIIPAIDHINEYLTAACKNIKLSKAIRAALALGKQTLNCYYNKTDHSDVYRIAMGTLVHSYFYLCPSSLLYSSPPTS